MNFRNFNHGILLGRLVYNKNMIHLKFLHRNFPPCHVPTSSTTTLSNKRKVNNIGTLREGYVIMDVDYLQVRKGRRGTFS